MKNHPTETPSEVSTLKMVATENLPRIRRATYSVSTLVVPSIIAVDTAFRAVAAQSPCRLPNLELTGPTKSDPTKVPIVMSEEMSCWTVG